MWSLHLAAVPIDFDEDFQILFSLGGTKVLGKSPVLGRPANWIIVGQGPIVLAVGAGGSSWTFFSHLSLLVSFSLSLGDGPI